MNANPRDTMPHTEQQSRASAPAREEARKRRRERRWRIGATQVAAPPTRRWRRSGSFSET